MPDSKWDVTKTRNGERGTGGNEKLEQNRELDVKSLTAVGFKFGAPDKTTMLRRLLHREKVATVRRVQSNLHQRLLLHNGHFFGRQDIH